MKYLLILISFLYINLNAQKIIPFDSLKLKATESLFVDDYQNFYLYKNKDFSFTKYDSLGQQLGRLMLTLPFKVQNVQNPLNIVLFSENSQEIKFIDQNLNEIQKINLSKFGFIKMTYAEDLQQIWLLDDSVRRLIQYNFREDKIINSFALNFNFDKIKDMLIFENKIYLITNQDFLVYNFNSEKLFSSSIENLSKIKRENDKIYIISRNKIYYFYENQINISFKNDKAKIMDKNSSTYFVISDNKVYLYPSK